MNNKKILIIAYKFAPYNKTDTYRITRLIKALAEMGYKIHVVTVKWRCFKTNETNIIKDHKNITIHTIGDICPHNLYYYSFKNNFFGRILNKFRNQIIKLLNIFFFVDTAQLWGYNLIPYCQKIIKKYNLTTIIVSGAPFMQNYHASKLKNSLKKDIVLIHDFRDEWTYGKKCRKKELFFEKYTINNCDAIVTVSNGLLKLFKPIIKNKYIKTKVIKNGYEKEKIENIKNETPIKKREFSFIYAGGLHQGRYEVLDIFLNEIQNNIKKFPDIKIIIYTSNFKRVRKKFSNMIAKENLKVSDVIPKEKLYTEILKSFSALQFMPESTKFLISVKLFEHASLKRPTISINGGGDSEELIKTHQLGHSINYITEKEKIISTITNYYKIWKNDSLYEINPIELEKYTFKNIATEYNTLIEQLHNKNTTYEPKE